MLQNQTLAVSPSSKYSYNKATDLKSQAILTGIAMERLLLQLGHVLVGDVAEAELGVVEDVVVGARQAVLGRANQQLLVVLGRLPPVGHVVGVTTQAQALIQLRVPQHRLADLVEEVEASHAATGALLRDRLHEDAVRWHRCGSKALHWRVIVKLPYNSELLYS